MRYSFFKKLILRSYAGVSLVEGLLAVSVFSLFLLAVTTSVLQGQEGATVGGKRTRAELLADEGLEVARNVRDGAFSNLVDGTYVVATSGAKWNLASGASETIGAYTRKIIIGTIDSDTKIVTSTVTWEQNNQRSGTVEAVTYLTNWRKVNSSAGGMLVYGDGGTTLDKITYRTLTSSGVWSPTSTAADVDAASTNKAVRALTLYASATRDEKVLLTRHYNGSSQFIYAQVYNGSSWGNVQLLASWTAATFLDVQNFDGTYLANGSFMVVYSDNTVIPKSRIWNGASWSAQGSLTSLGTSQTPTFIVAKARPNTNEVMAAFFTQGSDTITQYYNGTAWSAITSHATAAPVNTKRLVDFDWSPANTLKGGLVFSNSSSDRSLHIKIWTANGVGSGSWGLVANTANQGTSATRLGAVSIVGRPGTSEFIACNTNTVPSIMCYKSDLTPTWTNPTNQTIASLTQNGIQRTFDSVFESSGATGLGVYSDNSATLRLKKYTAAASVWDASPTAIGSLAGTIVSVRLRPLPGADDVMVLAANSLFDLYSEVWDGTNNVVYTTPSGFALTTQGISGSATAEYWYDFVWDKF